MRGEKIRCRFVSGESAFFFELWTVVAAESTASRASGSTRSAATATAEVIGTATQVGVEALLIQLVLLHSPDGIAQQEFWTGWKVLYVVSQKVRGGQCLPANRGLTSRQRAGQAASSQKGDQNSLESLEFHAISPG